MSGKFQKRNIGFNLKDKLSEVEMLMKSKAEIKGLKLLFEANYDETQQITQVVQYDQLMNGVLACGETIEQHPLLNYLPKL